MDHEQVHPLITALTIALERTARMIRVPVQGVRIESIEAREWPDSCLGLPEDGEICHETVTPGYLIRLHDGFTYRADEHGGVRRQRTEHQIPDTQIPDIEIRLRSVVEGGIAGHRRTFETSSMDLSEEEESELRSLIDASDFFNIHTPDNRMAVYDGYTHRLWIAVGRRQHEVVRGDGFESEDSPAFLALLKWVAQRTPPIFPHGVVDL